AFTSDRKTYQQLSLAWGVHPLMIRNYRHPSRLYESALHILKKKKLGKPGEVILMVSGTSTARGSANTIRFQRVR
ncbi:MAG: pyruvate kinase alpha/beta domain-containing protein, partial [Planctomycetota bacterium]